MQESGTQKSQARDALAAYPPILVVGSKMVYLRAYDTIDEAVKKVNENFLAGGYYDLPGYGFFDRYRLVDEVRFFDASGRELKPVWPRDRQRPASDKDAGYRLTNLVVKDDEPYVRSRFRAMLQEVRPKIEHGREEALTTSGVFDDSPEKLPDNKDLGFEDLCRKLVVVLADSYADGFWHKVFGGH